MGPPLNPSATGAGSAVHRGQAVLREDPADALDAEVLDAEGEMVEPRRVGTGGAHPRNCGPAPIRRFVVLPCLEITGMPKRPW